MYYYYHFILLTYLFSYFLICSIVDLSLLILCIGHSVIPPVSSCQKTIALSAEILLPPHCFHLYRNSGSLLNIQLPDAGVNAGLPLHLLKDLFLSGINGKTEVLYVLQYSEMLTIFVVILVSMFTSVLYLELL